MQPPRRTGKQLLRRCALAGWLLLAFVFAGVWVYAVYREDRKNPEPLWLVGLAIVAGAAALPVANWLEGLLVRDLTALDGSLGTRAGVAFLVAGPVEEAGKLIAVALLIWFQGHFDEPLDGIVYAAAAAAGFALAENLLFLHDSPDSIAVRGPAATAAHVLFAGFWGGALGHAKQLSSIWRRWLIVATGLLLALLAHGAFDLTTWTVGRELSLNQARMVQIALLVVCFFFLRWRIRAAVQPRSRQELDIAAAEAAE